MTRDEIAAAAGAHPDAVAWADLAAGSVLTFAEWDGLAGRLAAWLADRGVRPGERVAIGIGPTRPFDWLVAYAAVHRAGAVAVPLNTRLAAPELRAVLRHAEPVAVLADAATDAGAPWTEVTAGIPGVRLLATTEPVPGAFDLRELLAPGSAPPRPAADVADVTVAADAANAADEGATDIMYTSGTTGAPKGVLVHHPPPGAALMAGWSGLGFLTSSPFSTTSGALLVYGPMRAGMTGWFQPRFDAGDWISIVEGRRPAVAFVVPAMAQLIAAHPRFGDADLSGLAALTIGGAPIAPATLERLAAGLSGAEILVGYGLTEFGAVTSMPAGDRGRHLGSVGRPLPGVEVAIVDAEGVAVGPEVEGEITVSGSGRPRCYFREADATARTWKSGRLHTGDLGRLDGDGFLWVTGRTKDLIIRGGHNIAPGEVENALYAHPEVVEAAVAGVPHDVLGEDVGAWVVLRSGSVATADELRAHLAARLADYKVPRRIQVVGALPRNASGKVAKLELVSGFAPAPPAASAPPSTPAPGAPAAPAPPDGAPGPGNGV